LFALSAAGGFRGAFVALGKTVSFSILVPALLFFGACVSLLASKLLGVLPA